MKVVYDDPSTCWAHIKTEALGPFLREQGASAEEVFGLTIHLGARIPARFYNELAPCSHRTWGLCSQREQAIFLAVEPHQYDVTALNNTLLHEVRHFLKKGYRPGEIALPHRERPSEIDARAFAKQYEHSHRFVTMDRKSAVMAVSALAALVFVVAAATYGTAQLIRRVIR